MKPSKSLCVLVDFSKEIVYVNEMVWLLSSNSLSDGFDLGLKKRGEFGLRRPKHFKIPILLMHQQIHMKCACIFVWQVFISYIDTFLKNNQICFLIDKIHFRNFYWCRIFFGARIFWQACFVVWFFLYTSKFGSGQFCLLSVFTTQRRA